MSESEMTLRDIAAEADVKLETMRGYHKAAARARRNGTATPADLPAPVSRDGTVLVWNRADVDKWKAQRATSRPGGVSKKTLREIVTFLDRGQVDQALELARKAAQ